MGVATAALALITERRQKVGERYPCPLRPAVIARKLSHCSKNDRGARAFEAFTSVLHTIRKMNSSDKSLLAGLLHCSTPSG